MNHCGALRAVNKGARVCLKSIKKRGHTRTPRWLECDMKNMNRRIWSGVSMENITKQQSQTHSKIVLDQEIKRIFMLFGERVFGVHDLQPVAPHTRNTHNACDVNAHQIGWKCSFYWGYCILRFTSVFFEHLAVVLVRWTMDEMVVNSEMIENAGARLIYGTGPHLTFIRFGRIVWWNIRLEFIKINKFMNVELNIKNYHVLKTIILNNLL